MYFILAVVMWFALAWLAHLSANFFGEMIGGGLGESVGIGIVALVSTFFNRRILRLSDKGLTQFLNYTGYFERAK